ncbi:Disease resistance protein RML1B [Cardamine amara subsp. amara]|uniref:Disease resistance protein RML1B n=1 Tax=Cardamine amara subsp. amara TaxID=228776 RepID=A0ABD0ZFN7_CARAN
MHVLVEKMGKEIVREESKSTLQKQRILWEHLDARNVLRDKTGTNKIEGLAQDMCQMHDVLLIKGSSFNRMPNVKFLKFYTPLGDSGSNLRLLPDAASLPPMLKLLHWDAYPLRTLPSLFSPQHLVELTMRYSKLRFLCNKNRDLNLEELKRLDVSRSKGLRELPDLSSAMKLEELVVEGCEKLKFLKELPQTLKYLNAHGCKSLKNVSLPYNHYIEHLDLSDCSQLNQNEELITHFLTRGQNEELQASPRFACILQNVIPTYFNNQSRGSTIQLSPNLVDFYACIMITCARPFHLKFSKSSYSLKWEADGVFWFNLKPDLYLSLETEEEETIHHLVIIQGLNNDHAGNFLSTLQHPPRFDSPTVEIIACGVRMNPQEIPNQI